MVFTSLILPRRWIEMKSLTWFQTRPRQQTSGKATSQGTIGFIGLMCGILCKLAKMIFLCGPFGTSQLQFMNGEPALLWLPFPSNAFSTSLTLVDQFSISFGTASKPRECGGGRLSSCMSFLELERATMTIITRKTSSLLGKGSLRTLLRNFRWGTSFAALCFG